MIKFFRNIRKYHISEDKVKKYFLYGIGEIILVMIGILLALQVNTWKQDAENKKLVSFYMKSLANDLTKDTLDINFIIQKQVEDTKIIEGYLQRIYNPSSTIDTLVKIARTEFNYSFKVKRDYATNTFNTIISSGNIELLDKRLVEKLMELHSLQLDQLKRFDSNLNSYQTILMNYLKSFPLKNLNVPKDNIVDTILWNDINEKEFVGNFTTALSLRNFTFENTIKGHLKVKDKSEEILELITVLME